MKGMVFDCGNGTRLNPIIKGISKKLLPIYDKPMIYYTLQAFTIGVDFIGNDSICLVLGDNIFFGRYFTYMLKKAVFNADVDVDVDKKTTVFDY